MAEVGEATIRLRFEVDPESLLMLQRLINAASVVEAQAQRYAQQVIPFERSTTQCDS